MYEDRESSERRFLNRRIAALAFAVSTVFILLAVRLYYLQVVRGPLFRTLSEENRISQVRVRAPRGNIYDRYGNILVTNRPSFSVNLVLENVGDLPATVAMVSKVLDVPESEVEAKVHRVRAYRNFEPLRIQEDVTRETVALLEAERYEWPGVQIEVEPRRSYPHGKLAAHILGQVGEISPGELKAHQERGYRIGDYIGKKGIEKILDEDLKGRDGVRQVEVDSLGREIRVLASREPSPGQDVFLTLDLGVQQVVEESLGERPGAVVVLDSEGGEVIAAASSPAVDPNRFIRGLSREEWTEVERDERHPLQNRVIQAQYPPGSVFKIVTALAALEKGIVDTRTTFYCRGGLRYGDREYRCWKRGGHGDVDMHRALVESCDVYFYQLGIKAGIDNIAQYARELGLGEATGIGLGGEAPGLVPSRGWKKRTRGEPWYPGETLSVAIGQGYNLVTPIQMAVLAAVMGNGGRLQKPVLVRSGSIANAGDGGGQWRTVKVASRSLEIVQGALAGVVGEPRGTGKAAAVDGVKVAGKTGTAQVVKMARGSEVEEEDVPERFRDHAWFVCYAPGVAIAVLVEHGGHGGSASAPIARKILEGMRDLGFFESSGEKVGEAARPWKSGG